MAMKVKVRLPDHDFPLGSRHLLVPSVKPEYTISEEHGVSYCGETYVAVRSSKHNNSSAYSHQQDMRRMEELLLDTLEGRSVLIKAIDGGPGENPWFLKNQLMNIPGIFQSLVFHLLSYCPLRSFYDFGSRI